jgi:pilus assembly protein Flp/PilA
VEYAVMLALIIVVCIAAITTLGSNANSTFSFVGSSIQPPAGGTTT